jgi:hypothetical protein
MFTTASQEHLFQLPLSAIVGERYGKIWCITINTATPGADRTEVYYFAGRSGKLNAVLDERPIYLEANLARDIRIRRYDHDARISENILCIRLVTHVHDSANESPTA